MNLPPIVSHEEWQATRDELLLKEETLTWEDPPERWPQTPTSQGWRLHDAYGTQTAMPMADGKARA